MVMPDQDALDAFERLMSLAGRDLPAPTWDSYGDLSRRSIEAMVAAGSDPRDLRSEGRVRLTGAGVTQHSADLDDVGSVAMLWQRCVTAIGAAIEGSRSSVGPISGSIRLRTQLQLDAGVSPGSVVLAVSPKSDPLREVTTDGMKPMVDVPRPLADQAAEALLRLLGQVGSSDPTSEGLGLRLTELGPRVSSAVKALATQLDSAHFDLDAEWAEPEAPTVRTRVSAGQMGWLRDFVSGRALDAVEEVVTGTVRTVSDMTKWTIQTPTGFIAVAASELSPEEVTATTVGQHLTMTVLVRVTERPDGSTTTTREALRINARD